MWKVNVCFGVVFPSLESDLKHPKVPFNEAVTTKISIWMGGVYWWLKSLVFTPKSYTNEEPMSKAPTLKCALW